MAGLFSNVSEKFCSFPAKWAAGAALGSFALYLFGYLTLRFQLSTYGVATDLDIFDEKYLFAGCRFLVYLVSSVPNILIVVLPLCAVVYLPWRLAPQSFKDRIKMRSATWRGASTRLPLLGVILAVIFIQLVLRRCFGFGNLLLREQPPDDWLSSILLASEGKLSLYFSSLVAGTLLTGIVFFLALDYFTVAKGRSRVFIVTLGFLVAVEFLLLPVNYGVLIATQELPRVEVSSLGLNPSEGHTGWLVWTSKDSATYFVRDTNGHGILITIPRKDSRVTIVAYDRIFRLMFAAHGATPTTPVSKQP